MMLSLLSAVLLQVSGGDLLAIRVRRAETVSDGPIEHALILVENGKIVEIGEDLPLERGIPVLDRPDWIAMPGLVSAHTRPGSRRTAGRGFEPEAIPTVEIDPRNEAWGKLLELGVTTLGFYPAGNGIPGQAIALRPYGESVQEMLVAEPAYLKVNLEASASSKKALRDAFKKVDDYDEKVAKELEKWEKEQEKAKKKSKTSSKKKSDEEKDAEKDNAEEVPKEEKPSTLSGDDKDSQGTESTVFTPTPPDEKVKPFIELRKERLTAMMSINKAADYLHLLDVIESEESVRWFLQFPLRDDCDLYEVVQKIGEKELLVLTEPDITLQTNSLRERNIPAELVRAGAKVALTPRSDTLQGYADWLPDVGRLIGQGLPRDAALAAVTLESARALGLEEQLGSLQKERIANVIFWSGDPFEPSSRVEAVMLDGKFVVGGDQ